MSNQDMEDTYKTIMSWNNDETTWPDASMNIATQFKIDIKETNTTLLSDATNKFNNNTQMLNVKNITQQNKLRKEQNNSTKVNFLKNYIYIILKIICFLLLFVYFFIQLRKTSNSNNPIKQNLVPLV